MTITYDPNHPNYLDEADVRGELTRVFDVCSGCRRCVDRCPAFPTLFTLVDALAGGGADPDAGLLTPADQDRVIDDCYHCKLCALDCPYTPARDPQAVDVPRLMLRAEAMRHAAGQGTIRRRLTDRLLGHTDTLGSLATRAAPMVNRAIGARPGGVVRTAIERFTGVSRVRLLPPFARQRFSTWFRQRPQVRITRPQGSVAVFPTCLVEYHDPEVGSALVGVYERNRVECTLAATTRCCGAPHLHSGDLEAFAKVAAEIVRDLAASVRDGFDIVVPQPTCGFVVKFDYPVHVGGADAELVATHTYDACEYLMNLARGESTHLDTNFTGVVPESVAYHTPCHLKAQDMGLMSRDLMRLTGTRVRLVQRCSGTAGRWGLRPENVDLSTPIAERLGDAVSRVGAEAVAGDCHLANTAIVEQTGVRPVHPLQVLARAYGLTADV